MTRLPTLLALALFAPVALSASVVTKYDLASNFDGSRSTEYQAGNKPEPGCETPDGWTETTLGAGFGESCDDSGNIAMNGGGMNSTTSLLMLYQDAGSGDIEVRCQFDDPYTGASDPLASVGCGIREATTATGFLAQCHSAQSSASVLEFKYGSGNPYTTIAGATGQTRPRYCYLTLDKSLDEIRAYGCTGALTGCTEIGRTNFTFTGNPYAWVHVQSKSTTEALQATIKNPQVASSISVYTPEDPDPDPVPVLISPIGSQSATQGVAFSFDCNSNFSGATSYSFSGLPTGITRPSASSCAISGTPSGSGTSSVTVTASNAAGSASPVGFSIVVTGVPGSVFRVPDVGPSVASTFDCSINNGANGATWVSVRQSGSATRPGPGDTVKIAGGTRGEVIFKDCQGSPANYVRFMNDTADSEPVVFQRTGSAFATRYVNLKYFELYGRGGWSGNTDGCGVDETTGADDTDCGIKITKVTSGNPTAYMKFQQGTSDYIIDGIEIDGVARCASGTGLAVAMNDQATVFEPGNPRWRENVIYRHMYIHDTGGCGNSIGEAMYLGSNSKNEELPIRNMHASYNRINNSGGGCMKWKNVLQGTNSAHHNHFTNCGGPGSVPEIDGFQIKNVTNLEVYANRIRNTLGSCIDGSGETVQPNVTPSVGYIKIHDNILSVCGTQANFNGYGVQMRNANMSFTDVEVDYNTIDEPFVGGIDSAANMGCISRNNILSGSTAAKRAVTACPGTNNAAGTQASFNFVNAGSANYELTSSSASACNKGTGAGMRATDYEDETRPQDGAPDIGGDEAAACP